MAERKQPAGQVRQQRPLALRLLGVLVTLALLGLLLVWGIDLGRRLLGASHGELSVEQQLAAAQAELTRLTLERDQLLAAADGKSGADQHVESRIKSQQLENSQLMADLALLDTLIPAEKPNTPLAIRGAQADLLTPTQLHYAIVLARGANKAKPQFSGRLQLELMVEKDGKNSLLELPRQADDAAFQLIVQQTLRRGGEIELPPGATAKVLQVRVLEQGKVVAQTSVNVTAKATDATPRSPPARI
ncbi:DUF6776 family protein [Rugamonas sp.]|uniref:DUF6776 family protein n=1 Tax=Rugamonas sp. TaxID=1926287 RepID=UPI0025DD47FC|nr:DUF6776 family protein [Rugamonas sp.]